MKAKNHIIRFIFLAFALALCTAFLINVPVSVQAHGENEQRLCKVYFCLDYYLTETYTMEVLSGETVTLPEYPFKTKEPGMTFIGWEDPLDYTYSALQPGTNFPITGDYYFYAKFEKEDNTYMKVRFAPNYDDRASGQMTPVSLPKGSVFTLPAPSFTPAEGWEFDCWYPDLKPGDTYQLPENQEEYTFWAVYKEAADTFCEIIYDDGSNHTYTETVKKNTKYSLAGQVLNPPTPGRKLDGWIITEYIKPSGSTINVGSTVYAPNTVLDIGNNSTIKLKAKWILKGRIDECTITVDQGAWYNPVSCDKYSSFKVQYRIYENYYYCGQPITPIYTVRDADGRVLTEGVEYTAEYSNNVYPGDQALITITGINGFANTGVKTATFTINKLELTYEIPGSAGSTAKNVDFSCKIIGDDGANYYYTGKEIKPVFTVTYYGRYSDKEIVLPASDFKLRFTETPISVGYYTYYLESAGDNVVIESGFRPFRVIPPCQHIRKVESRYTAEKNLFGMGVTFDKLTKALNRVEIKVMWGSKFKKSKTYTVSGKGKELLDFDLTKKMLKAGKIKIRVRYVIKVNGVEYEGPWSSPKTIKLKLKMK